MAKYPLTALLSAREFREEAASRDVMRAREAVGAAHEALELAVGELARYREWKPGEEVRLFEELRGKELPLSALDGHRADLQRLREGELDRAEGVRAAEQGVADAEAALEQARRVQLACSRDHMKIDEHRRRWQKAEGVRAEAAEESELEDFSSGKGAGGDEESDHER